MTAARVVEFPAQRAAAANPVNKLRVLEQVRRRICEEELPRNCTEKLPVFSQWCAAGKWG